MKNEKMYQCALWCSKMRTSNHPYMSDWKYLEFNILTGPLCVYVILIGYPSSILANEVSRVSKFSVTTWLVECTYIHPINVMQII